MPTYTQAGRPLSITTPLGPDLLLLTGFRGFEAISRLFSFELDLLAERDTSIRFDRIVGQSVTIALRQLDGDVRHFNGLVNRFAEGARDETFVAFRAEVVPKPWLLTKKVRSRIFQHMTVPDILEQVLSGFDVAYKLVGHYYERNYCVQYRESDFDFASRLMEEEGIHYFFVHSDGSHQMVVTDLGNKHAAVPGQSSVIFEETAGGMRPDMRIVAWEKTQELRSSKYTVWDHCFELPGQHLDETVQTIDQVKAGKVSHKLDLLAGDLEIYEYPGGYAKRFDSVDSNRGERSQDMGHVFEDRSRTVRVRMEAEESVALDIAGRSNCGNFTAGHQFTLQRHFDADGDYLLTRVEHEAHLFEYRSEGSGEDKGFTYQNRFSAVPAELRYRPQRVTAKPAIAGIQTATVTCPSGEEIFCDKFGRVKVQFHWDREGKDDGSSSCWLRVAQVWAGKGWGAFFWPRVGHEVVVAFEEGDPDQPLILGSVYNAANMPPYTLPKYDQYGGMRSASVRGKAHENYNGVIFNDTKGHEHLSIHSEHNMSLNSEFDKMFHAGRHKAERVGGAGLYTVGSLPGGGGSGGGFDAGDTMTHPVPVGVVGLNAQMVYGENLSATTGNSLTLGVGNNVTVCINPLGLMAGADWVAGQPLVKAVLGSGLGGNSTFCLGTNASVVMGQNFDVNWGPDKVELAEHYKDHPVASVLFAVLGVVSILWVILYGAIQEARARAVMVIVFQAVVDALLIAIMQAALWSKLGCWAKDQFWTELKAAFRAIKPANWTEFGKRLAAGTAVSAAVLGAMMGPLLAILTETATD
jgi:type VI secretion system secreted protein VgrG